MNLREHGFRHEKSYKNIFWRQQHGDGDTGGDRLPGAGQHIRYDASGGRGDMALVKAPLRHRKRGARRLHSRVLRIDFVLPAKGIAHLRQSGLQRLHLCRRRAQIGPLLVRALARSVPVFQKRFCALEIRGDLVARRSRLGQVGLGLRDLGRLSRRLEVDELSFRLAQLTRGLFDGLRIGDVVLSEELRPGGNLLASLYEDIGEASLQRGATFTKSASA